MTCNLHSRQRHSFTGHSGHAAQYRACTRWQWQPPARVRPPKNTAVVPGWGTRRLRIRETLLVGRSRRIMDLTRYRKILIYALTFLAYAWSGYGAGLLANLRDAVLTAESVFHDLVSNAITVAWKIKDIHEVFDAAVEENCVFRCPDGMYNVHTCGSLMRDLRLLITSTLSDYLRTPCRAAIGPIVALLALHFLHFALFRSFFFI